VQAMAAADKLNGAYWRKRAIELAEKQKQEDDDLCLRFHREYERILHELDKEISIFYARYAANESVSMADARRLLRDAELEDFRMSLDEFRDKALAGGFDKELEEVYLRSRISRLQALQTQVELRMMELFSSQRDVLRDHLQERYTDTYYRTVYAVSQQADVASTFARIDPQTIERILAVSWVGSEFSSRIWADKDKLTRELMQTLSHGFVRGDSLDRMTKEFAQRMGVSESRAATLIHTESAHMAAEAAEQGYRETGVQSYRFEAALDLKTCAVCGALDQREFPLAEHETGINYPPLHPRCRCTTVPVTEFRIGSKRAARNPATGKTEYVEKKLTYEEWRKKYVEEDADKTEWEEYQRVLGEKAPKTLEEFRNIKYTESKKWGIMMENKRLFEKIDSTETYSPEYRAKLKETYQYFSDAGFAFREHALNRVLGQKTGKDKFTFTKEELLRILNKPANYQQPDGKYVRFYDGISVISADDTGEIVSVVVKRTPRKDWTAL
jgi:SPP1 gp7 family putative phage head morphogenesis protein